jgi:uncharacterized protein (TIGR02145 family)
MRNNLSNVRANSIRPLLLAASLALALAFTFSCSSDKDDDDKPSSNSGGGISSSSGDGTPSSSSGNSSSSTPTGLTGNSGTFTDSRDSKSYNWVKIGEQIWMTQDLNYDIPGNSSDVCYENNAENCANYGRLYTFADAKNVCPPGWDLPKKNEWQMLIDNVGGLEVAGEKLKANNTTNNKWNGTNDYNFNALPAGLQYANGTFGYINNKGIWWGSSGNTEYFEDHFTLNPNDKKAYIEKCGTPQNKHSVRCIYVNPNTGGSSSSNGGVSSSSVQTGPCTAANNTSTQYCSNGTMKPYGSTPAVGGKTYKTVVIGTQTWMAENMNYDVPGDNTDACYENNAENCTKYGRLYKQQTAMTVCPTGWHLPSNEDWDKLMRYVDTDNGGEGFDYEDVYWSLTAGKYLKSGTDWNEGNGVDKYGFSALPGGYREHWMQDGGYDDFSLVSYFGYWWSASTYDMEYVGTLGYSRLMYYYDDEYYGEISIAELTSPGDLLSVRCLKN